MKTEILEKTSQDLIWHTFKHQIPSGAKNVEETSQGIPSPYWNHDYSSTPVLSKSEAMEETTEESMEDGTSMMVPAEGHENVEEMMVGGEDTMMESNKVSFNVKGVPFSFDVKEMRVKKGDTVTVNFQSAEGFHDWVVDEFNAATKQVGPGTPTSVTFVADKAGTFEYYCSVGNHRAQGMVGKLIVE